MCNNLKYHTCITCVSHINQTFTDLPLLHMWHNCCKKVHNDNDNDKVFYSTLIIHFIFNTATDAFAY